MYFKEYILKSEDHSGTRDRDRKNGYKGRERLRRLSRSRERFRSSVKEPMKRELEGVNIPVKGIIHMIIG